MVVGLEIAQDNGRTSAYRVGYVILQPRSILGKQAPGTVHDPKIPLEPEVYALSYFVRL